MNHVEEGKEKKEDKNAAETMCTSITRLARDLKCSKKQLRQLIRPMFCSTIHFGYATPEQVENTLDNMFGVDSREVEK